MNDLGNYGGDYGSVDLFGLDEFGNPTGLNPTVGAAIGAGVQASVAAAVKEYSKYDKYAEGIGAVAGVAVGGAMLAMPNARGAGMTAAVVSLVGGGIRQLHMLLSSKQQAKAALGEFGLATIEPSASLGYPVIENQVLVPGSANLNGPPQLVGAGDFGLSQNPAAQQAQLVGPAVSGLASHFGSTIFG